MKRIFLSTMLGILTSILIFVLLNCASNTDKYKLNCVSDVEKNVTSLLKKDKDTWTSYWNKDSTRIGFKNKDGVIKTEPKFGDPAEYQNGFPREFDNIIAVGEEVDGKWDAYYFTKTGKTFGRDSIYFSGEGVIDCESEGFIRFLDRGTNPKNLSDYKYMGMFNRNGDVAIPAKYNYLTNVRNGMIIALEGAKKECWHNGWYEDCEHYKFVGGREMLIDTLNNVLVDNFSPNERENLNFFSIQKTANPHPDTIRESFLARDGSYYSFINFEKEFRQWLRYDLLVNLTSEKLKNASFETIWIEPVRKNQCNARDARLFIANNFEILKNGLLEFLNSNNEYYIAIETLNKYIHKSVDFEGYYDSCGDSKKQYPVMEVDGSKQIKYNFLRTDSGYKLIYVDFKNETLKL